MADKGDSFAHGQAMPPSHEADEYLNSIANVESTGEEFYGSKSGGGSKIEDSRSGPVTGGSNPFYGGGKKSE